jgi:sugar lactone lactonase YvrE
VTRRWTGGLLLAFLLLLLPAAPAAAVPDCSPKPPAKTLLSGLGSMESITSDGLGRLIFSQSPNNRLMRLDGPGATPKPLVEGIAKPGGLAIDGDGSVVAGYGDGITEGQADNGQAGLFRVDPNTGAKALLTKGLGMANGVARGPDGALYGSNDFAGDVDRFLGGKLETDWAKVPTSNGMAVDKAGKYLYVAQTFKLPSSIARVEIANPANVTTFVNGPADGMTAALDGMTRDDADTLYVAGNLSGEVWRVGQDKTICALASGLKNPSAVAFGGGSPGFPSRNLYVVGFGGELTEIAGATTRPAPAPPRQALAVTLSPKRVPLGKTTKVRATGTVLGVPGARPATGATVRLAGKSAKTDKKGRATLSVRFTRTRLTRAEVSLPGYRRATAPLAVG